MNKLDSLRQIPDFSYTHPFKDASSAMPCKELHFPQRARVTGRLDFGSSLQKVGYLSCQTYLSCLLKMTIELSPIALSLS